MKLKMRHFDGDPNRRALALHCMMGSAGMWEPLAERLEGLVDLSGFDFPSHGHSPDWDETSGDLHDAITRYAAALIDSPVDLIGHSFGATVALRLAVCAPQNVRTLTLIEPVLFAAAPEDAQNAENAKYADLRSRGDWTAMARIFLDEWGVPGAGLPSDGPRAERLETQMRMVSNSNRALMLDSGDSLRAGGMEAIKAPVMLISGENSQPIIRQIEDALAARLPDARQAMVAGAGHMLPLTHPDQLASLVATNLRRA